MPAIGLHKMAAEKKVEDLVTPDIIIAQMPPSYPKRKSIWKYLIISGSIVLAALIILTGILVGIYMFPVVQKENVKYTLDFDKNTKQDVTSDPNTNIVRYEIYNKGQITWVVNDFNRDIQVVKIETNMDTNCYISALNRTRAIEPSQITGPETKEVNKASTLTYVTSGSPISDTSFLAKAAQDICDGYPTYWLYPKCTDTALNSLPPSPSSAPLPWSTTPGSFDTSTENPVDNSPWYKYWSYQYNANTTVFCVTGCCKTMCACSIRYFWYYASGNLYCTWVATSCPEYGINANPVFQTCTDGPTGLNCPNISPATLPEC